MQTKVLSILAVLICTVSQAQEISIDLEVTAPFFSVVKDLRSYNVCVEESLGSEGIVIMRDDSLTGHIVAIADGTWLEGVIMIRYNQNLLKMPFKEQKFVLLHELLHHAGYFHDDDVLAVKAYSAEIPYYYEIALGQSAILLAH